MIFCVFKIQCMFQIKDIQGYFVQIHKKTYKYSFIKISSASIPVCSFTQEPFMIVLCRIFWQDIFEHSLLLKQLLQDMANVNPLYIGCPQTGTFTNSKDPDKVLHNAPFHQCLHCLLLR